MNGFDEICPGCEYREIYYEPKADEYGGDPIGFYCNKNEYGISRCPRAAEWRAYFARKDNDNDYQHRRN